MFKAVLGCLLNCKHAWTTEQNHVSRTRMRQRHTERVFFWSRTYVYMHTCAHAYIYACILTYMHVCIHTCIHSYYCLLLHTHPSWKRACQKASCGLSCTTSTQSRGSLAMPGLRISSTSVPHIPLQAKRLVPVLFARACCSF